MAHLTNIKYLNKSNILVYLDAFAFNMIKLHGGSINIPILIVGGSAIALKDGYRDATVDIDSYIKFSGNVSKAIGQVAKDYNIYSDWLNQDFAYSESYSRRLEDNAIYFTTLRNVLHIYLVCDLDQLCMKATAYRKKDIPDIKYLVKVLKNKGVSYHDFLSRFYYLYGDSVSMTHTARVGIERYFKKL